MKRKTIIWITAIIRFISYNDAERYLNLHDEVSGVNKWYLKHKKKRMHSNLYVV